MQQVEIITAEFNEKTMVTKTVPDYSISWNRNTV